MGRIRWWILAGAIALNLQGAAHAEKKYDIQGYGDHSLWVLVNDIKGAFEKDTGISLDLIEEFAIAGKGCAKGILHAFRGKPNRAFGLVCCEINEDAVTRYKLKLYPVAKEPLAIIVNAKNPVKGLTLKEVRDIFSGRITRWNSVGGPDEKIAVITRLHCPEHVPNWMWILGKPEAFLSKRMDVKSEPDMARTVSDFRHSIGHLEMTSIFEAKGAAIKVLAIDGHMPTSENMEKGLYPLYATLSVTTKGEAAGKVKTFIAYLRENPSVSKAMQKYGMHQLRQ